MGSQSILGDILITFPRETCTDYYFATQKEWIETNGIGGFASSTIIGANVRRYHGLLVASLKPPTHRFVLLSKLEENISISGKTYEFSTNQYPFIIYPEGHKNIERFEYDVYPR
ncbi:glycogen debranching enzyme N-terminal domain-containing protein, partial [bacterium]|nr:glycogen debranching enzyme N-terminal domain-containing protein [bacterium]